MQLACRYLVMMLPKLIAISKARKVLIEKAIDQSTTKTDFSQTMKIVNDLFFEAKNYPDIFPSQLQLDLTRFCSYKLLVNRYHLGLTAKRPPLDCLNCSFPQEKIDQEMSLETYADILNKYSRFGGKSVFLTGGGEPGEHSDFVKALQAAAALKLDFSFNTWGAALFKLNSLSLEELNCLYGETSKTKESYFISISMHDLNNKAIFKAISKLNEKFYKSTLDVKLRASLLIQAKTDKAEIEDFILKSKNAGVHIAVFKPAYYFNSLKQQREFVRNFSVSAHIENFKIIYSTKDFVIQALRADRLLGQNSFDYKRCFAPLDKIYVNVFGQCVMCCDTKDEVQGNKVPAIISNCFPETPEEYYSKVLAAANKFPNKKFCIAGCNMHEFNRQIDELLIDK
jgi:MoaA/NifB/PqqE/SkfB family radical SAM enzyme